VHLHDLVCALLWTCLTKVNPEEHGAVKRRIGIGIAALVALATVAVVVTARTSFTSGGEHAALAVDARTVAVVGDQVISIDEVDEQWRRMSPTAHARAVQELYEGRKAVLETLVADMIIEQASARSGLSDRDVESAIAARIRPIADDDVMAFYATNRDQLEGRSFEELESAIRGVLETRARTRAHREYVNELARSGTEVRILLDPPRRPVEVGEDDPSAGDEDADVTVVAFSDFQCPFCARVEPTLKQVRERYGARVRLVWKDFPLTTIHPDAFKAAEAGHCAADQQKYWAYHDRMFANQSALTPRSLKQYAQDEGLDVGRFVGCLDSAKYRARVEASLESGATLGVESTPTIFINGRMVSGAQPYETFAALIDEELARAEDR
jgi:protein-disulfide isomerase